MPRRYAGSEHDRTTADLRSTAIAIADCYAARGDGLELRVCLDLHREAPQHVQEGRPADRVNIKRDLIRGHHVDDGHRRALLRKIQSRFAAHQSRRPLPPRLRRSAHRADGHALAHTTFSRSMPGRAGMVGELPTAMISTSGRSALMASLVASVESRTSRPGASIVALSRPVEIHLHVVLERQSRQPG